MIDYFFHFTNEAEAKANALMLADHLGTEITPGVRNWLTDHVLPNVRAWRVSQDVISGTPPVTTHTYLSGWFAIVSLNRQVDILLNAAPLAFALDRDGPPYVIKNNIGALITDIGCEPVFAGSHYPLGGYI